MGLLLGPFAILVPYAIAWLAGSRASTGATAIGVVVLFLVLRLLVYYRLPRPSSRAPEVDWWFVTFSLYLPLILYVARGQPRVGGIVYPIALATYLVAVAGYLTWQVLLWWVGAGVSIGKLLYVLFIVPLHLAAFTVAMLAGLGAGSQLLAAAVVGVATHEIDVAASERARSSDRKTR